MEMTPARWNYTSSYIRNVFGVEDGHLAGLQARATAAGLPDIAISADVGRLLAILTSLTNLGLGAALALELGTLGGYSAIWMARALAPGGKLITVEIDEHHAAFAQQEFHDAGVADRIDLRRAAALDALVELSRELPPASVDVAFFDAVKIEYPAYFELCHPLIKPGGLLLADNALGSSFWIDDPPGTDPTRDAVDAFNRMIAAHADYEAVIAPLREGVLIARKKP